MNRLLVACIALFIFCASIIAQTPAAKTGPAKHPLDKGNFKVGFSPTTKAKEPGKAMPKEIKELLQGMVDPLNEIIALPRDIYLNFDLCGQPNAFYSSKTHEITMCYELFLEIDEKFRKYSNDEKEVNDHIGSTVAVIFFHELGHCLIDVWELPATGREEDAVDQLAMVLMLDGSESGKNTVLSAALFFALSSEGQSNDDLIFWDEHSLNQQRFYDMLCLVYGSDPDKNKGIVGPTGLPAPRAAGCPAEYKRADRAWEKLLTPYLMSPD